MLESSMSDLRNDDESNSREGIETVVTAPNGTASDGTAEGGASGDKATSLLGQAKEQAVAALSEQKDGVADGIDGLADTVHRSAEQFEGKQDWIAGAIDRGAAELGTFATALRENDLAGLFRQVQTIARRQPALFIGASLAAGFAAARLGKLVAADVSRDDLPTLNGGEHARA
jgi:hypothetical protein